MAKKPIHYTVTDGQLVLTLEVAEEGGFTVTAPFVPGLVTEAETLEEAFEMARDAAAALKEAAAKPRRSVLVGKKRRSGALQA
jgi:antitoxin HicB